MHPPSNEPKDWLRHIVEITFINAHETIQYNIQLQKNKQVRTMQFKVYRASINSL